MEPYCYQSDSILSFYWQQNSVKPPCCSGGKFEWIGYSNYYHCQFIAVLSYHNMHLTVFGVCLGLFLPITTMSTAIFSTLDKHYHFVKKSQFQALFNYNHFHLYHLPLLVFWPQKFKLLQAIITVINRVLLSLITWKMCIKMCIKMLLNNCLMMQKLCYLTNTGTTADIHKILS